MHLLTKRVQANMIKMHRNKLTTLILAALASHAYAAEQEVMVVTASGFQQKIEDSAPAWANRQSRLLDSANLSFNVGPGCTSTLSRGT